MQEIDKPIRFQGQYHDLETGLHHNFQRYHDPSLGRYIHQDPIGLAGGLNHYQYAPNPVGWVDPWGLATTNCPPGGGGVNPNKKGVVNFEGMEVRAVRDLSHVDEGTLLAMQKYGFAAKDAKGNSLVLHHHQQNPAGPIIEMPAKNHSIGNLRQHPFGNAKGKGLTAEERESFNVWREKYWKWRASEELKTRGGS